MSWMTRQGKRSTGLSGPSLPALWERVTKREARTWVSTAQSMGADRGGLRRVDWVRLHVDHDGTQVRAEVMGVGFRLPVTCPVPLSVARDLIGTGTPFVIRHLDS
jgi:hypothetical protein